MNVGSVTTGDPGTEAAVTNSGTPQNAILDFVIPKGNTGTGTPVQLLTAYSTPSQSGTSGTALIFDRNSLQYGNAVSHSNNSSTFTVNSPGVYSVSFHSGLTSVTGGTFPKTIGLTLSQNGTSVPGANVQKSFSTAGETESVSFSTPIQVSSVPTTLQVISSGGSFLYSGTTMTVSRLGDIPS